MILYKSLVSFQIMCLLSESDYQYRLKILKSDFFVDQIFLISVSFGNIKIRLSVSFENILYHSPIFMQLYSYQNIFFYT